MVSPITRYLLWTRKKQWMNSVFVSTADLAITKTLYLYIKIYIKVVIRVQILQVLEKKTGLCPIYCFEPIFSRMAVY